MKRLIPPLALLMFSCSFSYDASDKEFAGNGDGSSIDDSSASGEAVEDASEAPDEAEAVPDVAEDTPEDSAIDVEEPEPEELHCEDLLNCSMNNGFCGAAAIPPKEEPNETCVKECLNGTEDVELRKDFMKFLLCGAAKCGKCYIQGKVMETLYCIRQSCESQSKDVCEYEYPPMEQDTTCWK